MSDDRWSIATFYRKRAQAMRDEARAADAGGLVHLARGYHGQADRLIERARKLEAEVARDRAVEAA